MRNNIILHNLQNHPYQVEFKPHGNSMTPKIYSGQKVKLIYLDPSKYRVGDIVYAKVNGTYYLHLITAMTKDKVQISNNHGHVNGWTSFEKIYGICIEVDGKEIISVKELNKR